VKFIVVQAKKTRFCSYAVHRYNTKHTQT